MWYIWIDKSQRIPTLKQLSSKFSILELFEDFECWDIALRAGCLVEAEPGLNRWYKDLRCWVGEDSVVPLH